MLRSDNSPDRPERAAHLRRVAHLCSMLSSKSIGQGEQLLEICRVFDYAAEFAAFEQKTISEAIEEFFGDAGGYPPSVVEAFRRNVCSSISVDLSGNLPVLPNAVARLMSTSPETATVAELTSIAASDAVLTARLVGTANSACFGSRNQIVDLRQAISRVGVPFARKVLLSASFGSLFASSALKMLWSHSLAVAASAHEIAGEAGCDQELAYIAGLLHDIGRLLTIRCPRKPRIAEADYLSAGFPLTYAETLVYGQDHAAMGAGLLSRWGLPGEIVDAVQYHHRPEAADSPLAAILCLAEDYTAEANGPGEALSRGMRRAAACKLARLDSPAGSLPDRSSMIFAIAG